MAQNEDGNKKSKTWYEVPIMVTICGSLLIIMGNVVTTLVPIMYGPVDSSDFYITVDPISVEAIQMPEDSSLPSNIFTIISIAPKGLQQVNDSSPAGQVIHQAFAEVHDSQDGIRPYKNIVFLRVVEKPPEISIDFEHPQDEPTFKTRMFVYINRTNRSIADYPVTIQGIGGDGKRRNSTFYVYYISPQYYVEEIGYKNYLGGRYDRAMQAYEKAIELDPKYVAAWMAKGDVLCDMKKYSEAVGAYKNAIEINPRNGTLWVAKGDALAALGRYNESIRAYDSATEIDPGISAAWNNKGSALSDIGRYEDAVEAYNKAIEAEPKNANAENYKGWALFKLGRLNESVKAYDNAVKLNPNYSSAYNNKGIALEDLGRYYEAIQAYDMAIKINPAWDWPLDNKGWLLTDMARPEEAIKEFDKAIELNQTDADPLDGKGFALSQLGRYEEAINLYDRAIKLDPRMADAWENKAVALKKLGRVAEAEAASAMARKLAQPA